MPLQPLEEFETNELISAHRKRYHDMVQNTAALERWLSEAQGKVEEANKRIALLEKALRDHEVAEVLIAGRKGGKRSMFVTKGQKIAAEWFGDAKPVPLSGMQMKVQATKFVVVGTIRHVRGDDPTNPKTVRFYVEPEGEWTGPRVRPPGCTCEHEHVEVNPDHVTGVL